MRFKLRQMEVFRAVMLSGSMSGAARLLSISQPAVSQLIGHTETTLGLRLFERRRGRLVPTTEAELLFNEVERLYEAALLVNDFATGLRKHPRGVLTVTASPSLATGFVPAVLRRFREGSPEMQIHFRTSQIADMARELLARQVSVAVSVAPVADVGITVEPFASGRMVCIAGQGHPIGAEPLVTLAQLARYPMVLYDRSIFFGRLIHQAFAEAGLHPDVAIEITRAELAVALVRQRLGVALVDEFSLDAASVPDVVIRPLKEQIPVTLNLLRSAYDKPSLPVLNFMRLVRQQLARPTVAPRKQNGPSSP